MFLFQQIVVVLITFIVAARIKIKRHYEYFYPSACFHCVRRKDERNGEQIK
jgi:hypothetical protein